MRLVILGAGGYGQTVADVARQSKNYTQICFLDDGKTGPDVSGKCSDFTAFADGKTEIYPAFGNNQGRLEWMDKLQAAGIPVPTLVHATAYVSPTVKLEAGTVVLPKALINTNCTVKRGCIINCGCIIDHDCVLEEGVHICPGAVLKAENRIPQCTKIESGQVIQNRTYPL